MVWSQAVRLSLGDVFCWFCRSRVFFSSLGLLLAPRPALSKEALAPSLKALFLSSHSLVGIPSSFHTRASCGKIYEARIVAKRFFFFVCVFVAVLPLVFLSFDGICGDPPTVADDILDCTATSEELGKTAGKVWDPAIRVFVFCSIVDILKQQEARRVPVRSLPHKYTYVCLGKKFPRMFQQVSQKREGRANPRPPSSSLKHAWGRKLNP